MATQNCCTSGADGIERKNEEDVGQGLQVKRRECDLDQEDLRSVESLLHDVELLEVSATHRCGESAVGALPNEEAKDVDRLGVEEKTHAPLNMRLYPRSMLSLKEFEPVGQSDLGRGALGSVQLVRWLTRPGQPLRALKRVSKFKLWKDEDPITMFEQLWDEIHAMSKLNHRNIVQLDGYFEDYKFVYLVLQYAQQGDLNARLQKEKRLSEAETARHIRSLIMALRHCHDHQFLHRDVKPENLFLDESSELLLGDFGCVATPHSSRKSLCGTRHYHAWEIANEEAHDEAADAWSVGCVTFELLTGKAPFESDSEEDESDFGEVDAEPNVSENDDVAEMDEDSNNYASDEVERISDVGAVDNGDFDVDFEDHSVAKALSDTSPPDAKSGSIPTGSSQSSSEDEAHVARIYEKILKLDYTIPEYVSLEAVSFIRKLLTKEPRERMTLEQALRHPFLNDKIRGSGISPLGWDLGAPALLSSSDD